MDDDLSEGEEGESEHSEEDRAEEDQQQLTDEECNRRWRRGRKFSYREEGLGPDPDTRRSLTELIEEAADDILKDQSKGKDIAWLFNHPNGRALLNRYIRKLYVYCPEIRSWLQVKWVDPRNAYDFYLTSPKKPPYNKTKLN
ncbi:hypothetical protein AAVH_25577 [Aphelenchoides avenae]|nr:hypothetical protein AAVH_25577 [Aphelenchus avenae]